MANDLSLGGCPVDTSDLPLAVYTPESVGLSPARMLPEMIRDLLASRELGWRLFVRDVSAQYRQSLLGFAWAFLPPILTGLVFIVLQSKAVLDLGDTAIPYPVFVLVGTIYWQIFVDALNAPLKSVTQAKPILTKINFPREALILSSAYLVIFNALLKAVVLIGVFVYFHVPVSSSLLLAPIAVVGLILLGLAIGLALTPIGILYTDVASGLVVVTQLWFFATPVIYPPPETFPLSLLATLNPVSPLLTAARDLTAAGGLSNPAAFVVTGALTIVAFAAAWMLYRVALPILTERMSA
ncbi:MAG: ABC transporter permease [Myxococcota bacterium]